MNPDEDNEKYKNIVIYTQGFDDASLYSLSEGKFITFDGKDIIYDTYYRFKSLWKIDDNTITIEVIDSDEKITATKLSF